ncbi:uncharacterized protein [Apostichopus japonicus]|uniref:uncharacterized protein isoform X1 n=1 Tax=Stichopus japonicus TaxID=307972 RepID=UPI003AB1464C
MKINLSATCPYKITSAVWTLACFLIFEGCLGMKTQTEAIGSCAKLTCTNNFTGEDVTSLWYFENVTITDAVHSHTKEPYNQDDRYTSKLLDDGRSASLEITNVTVGDVGTYSCVMYTGLRLWKEYMFLQIYSQPELRANKSILENETITAVCCVDVTPIWTIVELSWTLDEITFTPVEHDTQTNLSDSVSRLCSFASFQSDRKQHNKDLVCDVEGGRKGMSKQILNVWYPATVQMVTPSTINVAYDADILLVICKVDGNPPPDVSLQKLNDMFEWKTIDIKPLNKSNLTTQLWEFQLPSKDTYVNGMYRCTANNALGNIVVSSIISVEKDVSSSILRSDSSWIIYTISVIATFILALLVTMSTKKKCLSWCSNLRAVRRDLPQTPDFALQRIDTLVNSSETVEKNYLDMYASIDEEDHTQEPHKLKKFDGAYVTFVAQLNPETTRERWLGILNKGTVTETYTHMRSCTDVTKASEETEYFLRHIATLPKNETVVKTFGVFEKSGVTYCLEEYMAFGTVRTYLEITFGQSFLYGNAMEPVPQHFLTFASNVIDGMKFLHQNGWIHPGLSTEKLLISQTGNSSFSCKLYDFCYVMCSRGRLKEELEKNNGIVHLNIPPEAKRKGEYTRESDLWAVGVVLWEIFSYGAKIPQYKDILKPKDVLGKLTRPGNCPGQMYEAMSLCWQWDQQSRLSFDELNEYLQSTTETYMATTNQQVDTRAAASAMEPQPDIYNKEIYKVSN